MPKAVGKCACLDLQWLVGGEQQSPYCPQPPQSKIPMKAHFGDVLGRLIRKIEARALIELSVLLAPIDTLRSRPYGQHARHDAIAVAGPVLAESARLTTADLVEIAKTKGQGHLLSRRELGETVTDILLKRDNREVVHSVASNSTSSLSPSGHALLVKGRGERRHSRKKAGRRLDIPLQLLPAIAEGDRSRTRAQRRGARAAQRSRAFSHPVSRRGFLSFAGADRLSAYGLRGRRQSRRRVRSAPDGPRDSDYPSDSARNPAAWPRFAPWGRETG